LVIGEQASVGLGPAASAGGSVPSTTFELSAWERAATCRRIDAAIELP
jgi:hypothetical protein